MKWWRWQNELSCKTVAVMSAFSGVKRLIMPSLLPERRKAGRSNDSDIQTPESGVLNRICTYTAYDDKIIHWETFFSAYVLYIVAWNLRTCSTFLISHHTNPAKSLLHSTFVSIQLPQLPYIVVYVPTNSDRSSNKSALEMTWKAKGVQLYGLKGPFQWIVLSVCSFSFYTLISGTIIA